MRKDLDERIYKIIGDFYDEGFPGCERYDRIEDFTKNLAIIPTSAKTGFNINLAFELLGEAILDFFATMKNGN